MFYCRMEWVMSRQRPQPTISRAETRTGFLRRPGTATPRPSQICDVDEANRANDHVSGLSGTRFTFRRGGFLVELVV